MIARIAKLLRIRKPIASDEGLLLASGATVPTGAGYQPGALFQDTTNGYLYINEGTLASANFQRVSALTAAQEALLGATAGTVAASKAVVVDSNKDITGFRNVTLTGLGTLAKLAFPASQAITATDDGTGDGTIADEGMLSFVTVDCDGDANHIFVLPTPTPGTIVIAAVGATGCEMRSSAPATVAINGGSGTNAESAIAASSLVVAICESATSWKAFAVASDGTTAGVEAAA
jgi:hypothetical protein